jgi:hypothetical protein
MPTKSKMELNLNIQGTKCPPRHANRSILGSRIVEFLQILLDFSCNGASRNERADVSWSGGRFLGLAKSNFLVTT